MAWFRRDKRAQADEAAAADPSGADEPETDTVGNPVLTRGVEGARHAAPDAGPTRAELRMIQFVAEGRVARTVTSPTVAFWRVDGAFATGTKASMLDWLLQEAYIELGPLVRVTAPTTVTERGFAVLDGAG